MNEREYQYRLDNLRSPEYDERSEHPSVEQLLLREAIRALTAKQRMAWEYHIYEKLTLDDIGLKMSISHQAVSGHIKAAEKRIKTFCKACGPAYKLLREQMK
jgi:DNA-directed RNA polymerase specialized sigma24 family protein